MGPLLLSRILDLNDIQSDILTVIFQIADDQGLLLIDTKDLRSMLRYVGKTPRNLPRNTVISPSRAWGRSPGRSWPWRPRAGIAAGTIGRQLGKSLGGSFGSFGKTLGGNLGASLGRGLVGTLFRK